MIEHRFYSPTFFIDGPRHTHPGRCTLLVRRYTISGTVGTIETSAWVFDDEDSMARYLIAREGDLQELPEEADGNPLYVPEEIDSPSTHWHRRTRREQDFFIDAATIDRAALTAASTRKDRS